MNPLKQESLEILESFNIAPNSTIEFSVNEQSYTLSYEWIIDSFLQANEESQILFVTALKKASRSDNIGVEKFFEGMGQLILMTHLSQKVTL